MVAMHETTLLPSSTTTMAAGEHLLIFDGTASQVVWLSRAVTHVARGLTADVRLDDHTVSRRHALLVRTGGGTRLIDDRSANGTFVNGESIADVVLADGDVITVGRTSMTFSASG